MRAKIISVLFTILYPEFSINSIISSTIKIPQKINIYSLTHFIQHFKVLEHFGLEEKIMKNIMPF